MKHTAGPWVVSDSCNDGESFAILAAYGKDEQPLGEAVAWIANSLNEETDEEFTSEENCANAALIAAAPELLEACVQTRNELLKILIFNESQVSFSREYIEGLLAVVERAITKAEEKKWEQILKDSIG